MDSLKKMQEASSDNKNFIERNNKLEKIVLELHQINIVVSLFRKEGFDVNVASQLNYGFSLFSQLKEEWEKDENSIIEPNDFFTKVRFTNVEKEIKQQLEEQWENFLSEKRPNVHYGQLQILKNIPDLREVVNELNDQLGEYNDLKNIFPSQSSEFQLVIQLSNEMKKLWSKLDSKNIPQVIMDFIKKAGTSEGISLEEITPEIIAWLKEHKLIHLCKVRFGR